MENTIISDENIKKLINDMQNDNDFMKNFVLDIDNDYNLYFENENDLIEIINEYNIEIDFIKILKNNDEKILFDIYIPCDDDECFLFTLSKINGQNIINIYSGQSYDFDLNNPETYFTIYGDIYRYYDDFIKQLKYLIFGFYNGFLFYK